MSNKITKEALELSKQYWAARLAEEQSTLEGLIVDQAEILSGDIGVDISKRIINTSDNIDVAESILTKLNKLQ